MGYACTPHDINGMQVSILLLVKWNPSLVVGGACYVSLCHWTPVYCRPIHVQMYTLHHTKTLRDPPPLEIMLYMSSSYCHMCIQMLQKTVLCKLTNPVETHEGRHNATWSSRGHFGPSHQPQPPHMMYSLPP